MRILLCNNYYYYKGGAERCFLDLSALLEAHGHEVIPFSMQHEQNLPTPYADYFISYVNYPQLMQQATSVIDRAKVIEHVIYSQESRQKIEQLIADTRPDVAHVHGIGGEISPSILPALKNARIPTVQTLHDYRLLCPQISFVSQGEICERCKGHRYYNVALRRCKRNSFSASIAAGLEISAHKMMQIYEKNVDMFIAPSAFLMAKFREHRFKRPMEHLPNFVDLEQFQPCYESQGYAVHYGRLVKEKGVMTLLEAMKNVSGLQLYIAGTGDAEAEMKQFVSENGLKNVVMLGHLSPGELIPLVQKAAFSIVPSEWYENYSMSVIESLACATPVIGAAIGGIPEQVIDGRNGLLFEMGNPAALAAKIRRLCDDPDLVRAMGHKAREMVEVINAPERHYEETIRIYRHVMNS